ncbi:MAG: DUF1846 family protein, partial [Clostridia bacterium]|nr:DUF1846 family protein [Clostridia bacterium]
TPFDRPVVQPALDYKEYKRSKNPERYENTIVMAMQLPNGKFVTGRSSRRMVAGAALILNAIKILCGYEDDHFLISDDVLGTMQHLKTDILKKNKMVLTTEEALTALAISASSDPSAALALEQLSHLRGCKAHCTAIISNRDAQIFNDLGIDVTCEAEFSSNSLYTG